MSITNDISRQDFNPHNKEGKQEILRNFLTYWIVCEGTFSLADLLCFWLWEAK